MKNKHFAENSLWIIYTLITLSLCMAHEPWRDELQAFLIARDLDFSDIFHQMRYEGHFALWSVALRIFIKSGADVWILPVVSWLSGIAAAGLLIRFSPFSFYTKIAVSASAALLFVYPVISRCYSLVPLLCFGIAALYHRRTVRPLAYGTLIALLLQTHVYLAGIAALLWLFFAADIRRRGVKGVAAGLGILAPPLSALLSALQVLPAVKNGSVSPHCGNVLEHGAQFLSGIIGENALWLQTFPFLPSRLLLAARVLLAFAIIFAAVLLFRRSLSAGIIFSGTLLFQLLFAIFVYGFSPPRSLLLIPMLVMCVWIAVQDNPEQPGGGRVFRTNEIPLLAVALFSVGQCALLIAWDVRGDFSGIRSAAEYIRSGFAPERCVVVIPCGDDAASGISAYLPEYKIVNTSGAQTGFYDRSVCKSCTEYSVVNNGTLTVVKVGSVRSGTFDSTADFRSFCCPYAAGDALSVSTDAPAAQR